MRKIERIFVHCTAGNQRQTVWDVKKEFEQKGWKNLGYHYLITADGGVHQLLDIGEVSNGVKGYNSTSINVSYCGGIDGNGKPTDNRTPAQKAALRTLLDKLKRAFPLARIMGHRDIWGKDPKKWQKWCPCFDAEKEYKDVGI